MVDPTPPLPPPTPPSEPCEGGKDRALLARLQASLRCYLNDIDAVLRFDPAARSRWEVVFSYPGLHALWMHRFSHWLWQHKFTFLARLNSHFARFLTGIEIHPGATIGRDVFIDHGMGVVIGETAVIGDECILYKGVVLGGTHTERTIRHPQLGKRVIVGSNACILGAISIGDEARIGSGSVVIRPVPAGATVVGIPGRIVPRKADRKTRFEATLDHADLPDPVTAMIRTLHDENQSMRERLERLEKASNLPAIDSTDSPHLIDADLATSDLPPKND